jgi:hypothetical protein
VGLDVAVADGFPMQESQRSEHLVGQELAGRIEGNGDLAAGAPQRPLAFAHTLTSSKGMDCWFFKKRRCTWWTFSGRNSTTRLR